MAMESAPAPAQPQRLLYVIGTADTKGPELAFLASELLRCLHALSPSCAHGGGGEQGGAGTRHSPISVAVIDVSIRVLVEGEPQGSASGSFPLQGRLGGLPLVSAVELLQAHDESLSGTPAAHRSLQGLPKAEAIAAVAGALREYLRLQRKRGLLAGAVGMGGSCGSALVGPALRALPLGFPRVLVSTMASADAASLVGSSDLTLIPSVADISGLNSVLCPILSSAAAAVSGMALAYQQPPEEVPGAAEAAGPTGAGEGSRGPREACVGVTMFGVTTPCVSAVQELLRAKGVGSVVFHATGAGGRAMEELLDAGTLQAVLDVTTTEVADLVVGGVLACSEERFEAMIRRGKPLVLSVGALDMVNFGAPSSVPPKFEGRVFYQHNPQVTLMRTSAEECRSIAQFIAEKVNRLQAPVRVLFPLGGLSALDKEGEPFHLPESDGALLKELQERIRDPDLRQVVPLPHHINDPEFAAALVDTLLGLAPELVQQSATLAPARPVPAPSLHSEPLVGTPAPEGRGAPKAEGDPERIHRIRARVAPQLEALKQTGEVQVPGLARRRDAILSSLRRQIAQGRPVIGGGAGTGISAKGEEAGGVDLIVIYNSGRFRMAGRGSLAGLLPYKDANAVVMEMASEVLPVVKSVPVLAGVCATDPFRVIPRFLKEIAAVGFAGVQNFPTVGLIDGVFRQNLEETGMSFALEVDMVAMASAMGFLTTPYAFNVEEAKDMAAAGADVVVAHMGLTTAGTIGAQTALTLDQSVERVQQIANAARSVKHDVIVLCHGGPISGPPEAEYILQRTTGVHGFYGASSMERLPVEKALVENLQKYKGIKLMS